MNESKMVSVKEIAEFFGVSMPTVSNWISRFKDDFPEGKTVEGSKRLRYVLHEVEEWHGARGLSSQTDAADRNLRRYRPEEQLDLLATLFVVINEFDEGPRPTRDEVLSRFNQLRAAGHDALLTFDLNEVEDELDRYIDRYGKRRGPALAEVLLQKRARFAGKQAGAYSTPKVLSRFITNLIPPSGVRRVLDLASGEASILREIAETRPDLELRGSEVDPSVLKFSAQISELLEAKIEFDIRDSLRSAPLEGGADVVFADPPLGMPIDPENPIVMPGWSLTAKSEPEFAFIAKAIENVKSDGIGIVLTANRALRSSSGAEFRRELLFRGALKAIVSLPARLRSETAIPLTMWIVGAPNPSLEQVLMVDASKLDAFDLVEGGGALEAVRIGLNPKAELNMDFAVRVPLRDLLTKEVNLRPEPWVAKASISQDPQSALRAAKNSWSRMQEIGGKHPLEQPTFEISPFGSEMLKVEDMEAMGEVTVFSGLMATGMTEDGEGTPVLSRSILLGHEDSSRAKRKPAGDDSGKKLLPDDVVVTSGPNGIVAKVWAESGWIGGPGLTIIRVRRESIDPEFLALVLTNRRNQAHVDTGSALPSVNVRSLEIPMLPSEVQLRIGRLAVWANATEAHLSNQLREFSSLKREVSDLLGGGQIAL
jgi:type I restriction-modification system DNA methylase subunit